MARWRCKYYNSSGALVDDIVPCPSGRKCYFSHPSDYEWNAGRHVSQAIKHPRWLALAIDFGALPVESSSLATWKPTPLPKFKRVSQQAPVAAPSSDNLDDIIMQDDFIVPSPHAPSSPPTASSSRVDPAFPFPFNAAAKWDHEHYIVAANTTHIPLPPDDVDNIPIGICQDGRWGRHEWTLEPQLFDEDAPHLAFIPLPLPSVSGDLRFEQPSSADSEVFPGKPGFMRLPEEKYERLQEQASRLKAAFFRAVECFKRAFADDALPGEDAQSGSKRKRSEELANAGGKHGPASAIAQAVKIPAVACSRMVVTLDNAR